jgi:hypothetical protein
VGPAQAQGSQPTVQPRSFLGSPAKNKNDNDDPDEPTYAQLPLPGIPPVDDFTAACGSDPLCWELRGAKSNSEALGANLEETTGQSGQGKHAHHIVPGQQLGNAVGRDILAKYHIAIDSADNGVFLDPKVHYDTYGPDYARAVSDRLSRAEQLGLQAGGRTAARQAVLDELNAIRQDLLSGKHIT